MNFKGSNLTLADILLIIYKFKKKSLPIPSVTLQLQTPKKMRPIYFLQVVPNV